MTSTPNSALTRFRSLTLRGAFTDDELLDILAEVRTIEAGRPEEIFAATLDDPELSLAQFHELLDRVPLPEGYQRSKTVIIKPQPLIDKLTRIYELVNDADWQSRAADPNKFAQFMAEVLSVIDIDNIPTGEVS